MVHTFQTPSSIKQSFITRSVYLHSGHWGINPLPPQKHYPPPSFLPSSPLNQHTVQAPPPFLGNPPYILVFQDSPLKVRSFSEPQKY